MTEYSKEITLDPPLTEISKKEHDFVHITLTSSSPKAIQWLIYRLEETDLYDRLIADSDIETITKE